MTAGDLSGLFLSSLIAPLVVVCLLLSPASALSAGAEFPSGLPPSRAAHALQVAIEHHRPVAFDANVQVESLVYTKKHEWFVDSTSVPLTYTSTPGKPPDDQYFRVVRFKLSALRVKPIPATSIIRVRPKHWEAFHHGVSVLTHRGVVRTNNAGRVPTVPVRLSNGRRMEVPVGLTSVNE